MKKIYIAGKVTGENYQECYHKFAQAESAIVNLGAQPVNPLRINKQDEDWGRAMVNCLEALLGCSTIMLLPDWQKSNGAKLEYEFAKNVGLEVIHHETTPLIRKDSCQHKYPNGTSAIVDSCGIGFCQLCGWDDYASLPSDKFDPKKCNHNNLTEINDRGLVRCFACGGEFLKIIDHTVMLGYRLEIYKPGIHETNTTEA